MTTHVALWIDHQEARIFHVDADKVEQTSVAAPRHHLHHRRLAEGAKAHPADTENFFHDVGRHVADADAILVLGPSTAKLEFIRHLHRHDRAIEPKVVGVETVDHPTDGQIVAYAKKYFVRTDRMG